MGRSIHKGSFKNVRGLLVGYRYFISFLVVGFILVFANFKHQPSSAEILKDRIHFVFDIANRPIDIGLNFVKQKTAPILTLIGNIREFEKVKHSNILLKQQVAILQDRLQAFQAINQISRLDLPEDREIMHARVVGRSYTAYSDNITINVGSWHGVKKGNGVINHQGLIGRVISTTLTYSRVALITDLNSKVPVRLTGSDISCIASGIGNNELKVLYLPKDYEITRSEFAISSGEAEVLPYGLYIGQVRYRNGDYIIKPAIDWSRLSAVQVILSRE